MSTTAERLYLERLEIDNVKMREVLERIANQEPAATANWCAEVARTALST
jgi:hypothetical protein